MEKYMQTKEHEYYENIGNWDFDQIKYQTERAAKVNIKVSA